MSSEMTHLTGTFFIGYDRGNILDWMNHMRYCFAPLEGITDDVFRSLHHRYFPGVDRYYTPFLSPTSDGPAITKKDLRQVRPENNSGFELVPQLLTNQPGPFLQAAEKLKELGYQEVNLNLGCPSGTVTAKGKGSGFLAHPDKLRAFLDEVFEKTPITVSIKTRLGMDDPEEFGPLLELYRQYPIGELTVHPRVRADLYRRPVRMGYFEKALAECPFPVALSGGVGVAGDAKRMETAYPTMSGMMLGRGLVANPALVQQIQGTGGPTIDAIQNFHGELFDATAARVGSPRNTMFRMKEVWSYLILLFDGREKYQKLLRKTTSLTEYQAITTRIFRELPLRQDADINWQP